MAMVLSPVALAVLALGHRMPLQKQNEAVIHGSIYYKFGTIKVPQMRTGSEWNGTPAPSCAHIAICNCKLPHIHHAPSSPPKALFDENLFAMRLDHRPLTNRDAAMRTHAIAAHAAPTESGSQNPAATLSTANANANAVEFAVAVAVAVEFAPALKSIEPKPHDHSQTRRAARRTRAVFR